ncbi:hypothetical protein PCANB_001176 [Pneumocystis canis]|nr:hypothetical protein PCK1_001224 [Pneumocystis canis]KAG5437055.1 hypothetical protein PCANB_001176 [Pneumocystis canis]
MSLRNFQKFKKLQENDFLISDTNENSEYEISLDYTINNSNLSPLNNFNRFSILNNNIQASQDNVFENDEIVVERRNKHNMYSEKRKTKKKNKNKAEIINENLTKIDNDQSFSFLEIAKTINEVPSKHDLLSKPIIENSKNKQNYQGLLAIRQHLLDSDAEMRSLFGKKVVDNNNDFKKNSKKRMNNFKNIRFNKSPLINFKESWPPLYNSGLSMDIIAYIDGIGHFKFVFSKAYQDVQRKFLMAVNSFDPNNFTMLLQHNPYHVDTLLQVSEILKHQGDYQHSIDLIERALYCLGRGFHPMFNISTGSVRLPFKYSENRSMYLALHKHIYNLEKKGCWKAAFEFNKLLLGLNTIEDNDSYGALLTIDFFALKAKEYDYIIKLKEWHDQDYLNRLPSFAFSYALAFFHKENMDDLHSSFKKEIVSAALRFPWVIKPLFLLLDICVPSGYESINPPTNLDALYMDIYLTRAKDIWNASKYIYILRSISFLFPLANKNFEEFNYQIPAGTLRYILLSGDRNLIQYLPPSVTSQPVMEYDPFPPDNSTYTNMAILYSLDNSDAQNNQRFVNSSEILLLQDNSETNLQENEQNSETIIGLSGERNILLQGVTTYLNRILQRILSFLGFSS